MEHHYYFHDGFDHNPLESPASISPPKKSPAGDLKNGAKKNPSRTHWDDLKISDELGVALNFGKPQSLSHEHTHEHIKLVIYIYIR